jgi:uncharacterized membrane protein YfcA
MALFGVAPAIMKPAALTLNILVALIAVVKYSRAGYFSGPVFWPLALASAPFAFIGGHYSLPGALYKVLVGIVLLYAAWQLWRSAADNAAREIKPPPMILKVVSGAGIGLLSGLTGVGGGIFFSPLFVFKGWAELRQISGVAAALILVNSIAGLLGLLSAVPQLPDALPVWGVAAVIGGLIGSEYGSRRLANPTIKCLLAIVVAIAGCKMIFTAFL